MSDMVNKDMMNNQLFGFELKQILAYLVAIFFFAIIAISLCLCCKRRTYPSELVIIDSLCNNNPDSAFSLINKISSESFSEDDLWYLRFLKIKQKVKCNAVFSNADEINSIVDYYRKSEDKALLPQVLYCAGCVYVSLNDAPQAISFFHDALDCIGDATEYDFVKSQCFYQLGFLLSMQGLDREAIFWQRKALEMHIVMNDTERCVYDYENMAWSYRRINKIKMSVQCMGTAWRLAKKTNRKNIISEVASQFASLYSETGNLYKAKSFIDIALINPSKQSASAAYSLALEIYSKLGENRQAAAYCDSVLKYGNVYGKQYAYSWLTDRNLRLYGLNTTTDLFSRYKLYTDSIELINPIQASANANAMYNYALREKKNAKLEKDVRVKQMYMFTVLASSAFVVFLLSLMYLIQLKRKKKMEERLLLLNDALEKAKMFENGVFQQDEQKLSYQMMDTDVYNTITGLLKSDCSSGFQNWSQLTETIYAIYPMYKLKILKLKRMSDIEKHVCLLLKVGLSASEISKLVCRSPDTIYSICRRLYEKNFSDTPSAKKWKIFIQTP